jgi:para-aminobenzoate synthetase/4-amino-4-deoxychorismate lyase
MSDLTQPGYALFPQDGHDLVFRAPREILAAYRVEDVMPVLRRVDQAVAEGRYAAGFVAFEAAPAFDRAFAAHAPGTLPLAWFGLYDAPEERAPAAGGAWQAGPWGSLIDRDKYQDALRQIREHIAAGDTYQVNYTFPMRTVFSGDPLGFFRALCAAQGGGFPGYIDTGRYQILSASPELFFRRIGGELTMRPMKGTRRRGRWFEEDAARAEDLRRSEKDRAENLMIVDLLRNDMGRVSDTGSVTVQSLFDVERYETVWQTTSTVKSRTLAPLSELMAALFPCGSVTGAPKIETMKIIRALEPHPRGVYCGAVGWCGPRGEAVFNVAIRTALVDAERGEVVYSVGSGVTWDSSPEGEYQECLDKAAILACPRAPFELLESLLYENGEYFLLEEHLRRLERSAAHFGFTADLARLRQTLGEAAQSYGPGPQKVRLLLGRDGACRIEHGPIAPGQRVRLGFAADPVDTEDEFLYHKTTRRTVYERARASRPDCEDVLLWNARGEITESAVANVVLEIEGERLTPPVESGLLPGTFRAHLLSTGAIRESRLFKEDVRRAAKVFLINSVRKWIETEFAG